mmetsp:Transcript_2300/g.4409  ORF Transcript_2300/g.4409 Transcript_2300/m.4409 type:complete len:80 (+) Transcript_2300:6126-6365(+)
MRHRSKGRSGKKTMLFQSQLFLISNPHSNLEPTLSRCQKRELDQLALTMYVTEPAAKQVMMLDQFLMQMKQQLLSPTKL